MDQAPVKMLTADQWILGNTFQILHSRISERYPVHWHEFYEIHFFVDGEGTHIFNGESYPITKGSLFLITPADLHELIPHPDRPFELYNFIFCEEFLARDLYELIFADLGELVTLCVGACYTDMEREFARILREAREMRSGSLRVIQGAVERILIDLTRLSARHADARREPQSSQYQSIQKALVYINHHFRDRLTLQDVARQVQISPNYFSECFHQTTGSQFQSYVQGLRLRFAKSLLRASELPVTDICFASGFNTLAHFERVFRQRYGLSPRACRECGRRMSGSEVKRDEGV